MITDIDKLVPAALLVEVILNILSILARRTSTSKVYFAGSLVCFCFVSALLQIHFGKYSDLIEREPIELAAAIVSVFSCVTPFLRWIRYQNEVSLSNITDTILRMALFGVVYSFVVVDGMSVWITVPIMAGAAIGLFARRQSTEALP